MQTQVLDNISSNAIRKSYSAFSQIHKHMTREQCNLWGILQELPSRT